MSTGERGGGGGYSAVAILLVALCFRNCYASTGWAYCDPTATSNSWFIFCLNSCLEGSIQTTVSGWTGWCPNGCETLLWPATPWQTFSPANPLKSSGSHGWWALFLMLRSGLFLMDLWMTRGWRTWERCWILPGLWIWQMEKQSRSQVRWQNWRWCLNVSRNVCVCVINLIWVESS